MDRKSLIRFFMWNTIFGFGLLLVWTILFATCPDFIYDAHTKFFAISREQFDGSIYALIGLFKILILTFYIFPLLTLLIINRRQTT